ncbi:MAG: diaminopimelate epimerase [Cellvibrio sp.]|uniref:diaminopimelate epimerase n=1 Tax=Cellvibrio sp. TaxID=1965322 RepID=UPI00271C0409|nr:diaminopimelate epimerase [Cellvibrio sp.]
MDFFKYHALGNSYIVMRAADFGEEVSSDLIRRICDANFGIGSDGVLLDAGSVDDPIPRLRIFNPDGSEAEKSGNGIRIFCRYLWDQQSVGDDEFFLHTKGGQVRAQVLESGAKVRVEMGQVSFNSAVIPVIGPVREVLQESIAVNGQDLVFSAATIGNPHCVIFTDHPDEQMARALGPALETHPLFPNRTNVQFVRVLNRREIQVEIWERGAGYTLASGSSSCAAAAVTHKLGYCDAEVLVHLAGGDIHINIAPDFHITMMGSVAHIAVGQVSREWQQDTLGRYIF